MIHTNILENVGNTPMVEIHSQDVSNINLYAKLEYYNPMGSVKDRAAAYILKKLLENKTIDKDTMIIESSSGNFGVALSAYCRSYGLKFTCIIDSLISPTNESIISALSTRVIKVSEPDINGGYLINRIKMVEKILAEEPNSYWINQYENKCNSEAYYNTLGEEICNQLNNVDYIFIGVSSGGTITGTSNKLKSKFLSVKVVAVDMKGSVIFGGEPCKRNITGIGSSRVPPILKSAIIDEVKIVSEEEAILGCHSLLKQESLFTGGSSGAVYAAIKSYFAQKKFDVKPNVVAIFPDSGNRYSTTIYCEDWYNKLLGTSESI